MLLFLYIVMGWLVGLAINHLANILPQHAPLRQWPRCPTCQTPYPPVALSGLLRLITYRNCPQCQQRYDRPIRSAMVELVSIGLFIFLFYRYGFTLQSWMMACYTAILLLITVTDLEHKYIYNVVIVPALILALIFSLMQPLTGFWLFGPSCHSLLHGVFTLFFQAPQSFWHMAILGGALGFIMSYSAYIIGNLVYGHGALGSGDDTPSTFLGLILGWPYILLTFVLAIFAGAFIPLFLLLIGRIGRKSYIPYGPFLTITGWLMLIWGDDIWQYYYC